MGDKVKVVGYAQRVFYENGIEYRDFSSDLVGNQTTSLDNGAQFTSSNFSITSTIDTKPSKLFLTKKYTPFMCLDDLKIDQNRAVVIEGVVNKVKLNIDKSNLLYYAYFGSLVEFIRVSLENIIINWPASIWVRQISEDSNKTGYTAYNIQYDSIKNETTFYVDVERLTNRFNINHKITGSIINTFNETNDLRNLTVNYSNYVIDDGNDEWNILGFTGNSKDINDNLKFIVSGDIFSGLSSTTINYHIKPNKHKREEFFIGLGEFESYILNRFATPKYKSSFYYNVQSDTGSIYRTKKYFVWPTSDGYNIDFDTNDYVDFVSGLIEMAKSVDASNSNLMVRFLTSDSISDFDTLPNCDGGYEESAGQKMNRTLKIYGREFDEIKKYIDGISFSNRVTYDKKDNIPDIYLKNLARVLGWELVSSVIDNDLLNTFLNPQETTFSGHSRGLTPYEADIEMWRRIILNTPWIWKSKGTRKSIEFFLNFIGTPKGLVTFNEYIYKAKKPLNVNKIKDILLEIYGDTSIDGLNIDFDGYPKVNKDTPNMYFQKGGLWYRETGGDNANIDILDGNNPHIGPYDGGKEYINQFECIIPNFSPVTIHKEDINTGKTNIFLNYNSGSINNTYNNNVYIDVVNLDNISLSGCYDVSAIIIDDPKPTIEKTDCGCETQNKDSAIKISIKRVNTEITSVPSPSDCGYTGFSLNPDGYVLFDLPNGKTGYTISQKCCEALGFTYEPSNPKSCWWNPQTPYNLCKGWVPSGVLENGLVIWSNPTLQIGGNYVDTPECCLAYGYTPVLVNKGNYECYDNTNNSGSLSNTQQPPTI